MHAQPLIDPGIVIAIHAIQNLDDVLQAIPGGNATDVGACSKVGRLEQVRGRTLTSSTITSAVVILHEIVGA
jgi:hypothetical protein